MSKKIFFTAAIIIPILLGSSCVPSKNISTVVDNSGKQSEGGLQEESTTTNQKKENSLDISTESLLSSSTRPGWTVFTDDTNPFTIEIPAIYKVIKQNIIEYYNYYFYEKGGRAFFIRVRYGSACSQDEFCSVRNMYDYEPSGTSTIDGKTALIIPYPSGYCDGPGCSPPFIRYVTIRENRIFEFTFYGSANSLSPEYQKILNSFKFKN